jgi:hypothetical protein
MSAAAAAAAATAMADVWSAWSVRPPFVQTALQSDSHLVRHSLSSRCTSHLALAMQTLSIKTLHEQLDGRAPPANAGCLAHHLNPLATGSFGISLRTSPFVSLRDTPFTGHVCAFTFLHHLQTGRERLGAPGPSNGNAGRLAGQLVPTDDGSGGGPPRSGNGDGGRGDGDG